MKNSNVSSRKWNLFTIIKVSDKTNIRFVDAEVSKSNKETFSSNIKMAMILRSKAQQ